ncbi:MAG TPA: SIMPL domain-containing protein [Myxococcota bacterium]|nr:SIMPL domain-containing protein [Myxococcota bacterium]
MASGGPERLFAALLLATGIALAGWLAGEGFARARASEHFVTVKGTSERDVSADVAIWPMRLTASSNDLETAHARLEDGLAKVREFLTREGVDLGDSRVQGFSVSDANAREWGTNNAKADRFVLQETLVVRSRDPDQVNAVSAKIGELVGAGVVLSGGEPIYVFTGLAELKPAMIAEATSRAREAAAQFAKDSKTRLGPIRRANQGLFEILARDATPITPESSQVRKTVRVVTTVDYVLE